MDPVSYSSRVVILIPVYRDWVSVSAVCRRLDEHLMRFPRIQAQVLLIDDGSPDGLNGWDFSACRGLIEVNALRLRANLGHQRAICAGLCHVYETIPCDWVLIMDGDGEDRPEDAARLLAFAVQSSAAVVLAERRKRLEGVVFRSGYLAFRFLHRMLTGMPVRFGNFSVISRAALGRLVVMPELWNHYAGAVLRSRLPFERVPIDRGKRLHGRSSMNLVSLVAHGLSGVATFYETVATRILIFNVFALFALMILLGVVLAIRLGTGLAIPGWATYTTGLIIVVFTQVLAVSFNLVFSLLSSRTRTTFVPQRDCAIYVDKLESLTTRVESTAYAESIAGV